MASEEHPPDWFRELVWNSLAAGLCPPVPLPFVEDWGRNYLRRRMVQAVLRSHGLSAADRQVRILSGEHDSGCLWSLLWFPFRWIRMIRIFYWVLSANRLMSSVSALFLEGYLLHFAGRAGILQAALQGNPGELQRLRGRIERTQQDQSTNPFQPLVQQALKGSMKKVRQFSREIAQKMWRARKAEEASPDPQQETGDGAPFRGLADELVRVLWAHQESLREVEHRFSGSQKQAEAQKNSSPLPEK